MPFEAGKPRPANAGRRAGAVNKKQKFFESAKTTIERLGFNAMEALVELAHSRDETIRIQAVKEVCKYAYVQMRAIELTGADGGEIKVQAEVKLVADIEELVDSLVNVGIKT